jgi:hypothetical protein
VKDGIVAVFDGWDGLDHQNYSMDKVMDKKLACFPFNMKGVFQTVGGMRIGAEKVRSMTSVVSFRLEIIHLLHSY